MFGAILEQISRQRKSCRTAPELFAELDPEPRLLMGPGPIDVYPRVLRAMSVPLQGQFDPQFTAYMKQVMALYRGVFRTENRWTLLIDGTARAGIEACLASALAPGDTLLVPVFGRFGHLKMEIGRRLGAEVVSVETEWGSVFDARRDRKRDQAPSPKNGRDQPRRHVHHHAAAARRDRRAVPQARRAALCRLHRLAGRQRVRDGRLADRHGVGWPAEMPGGPAGFAPLTLERPRRGGDQRRASTSSRASERRISKRATARSSARTISTSR